MFPLMFVAIAAGLGTAAAVAPTSVALAVIAAPFGGSFAALAVALCLARRNGAAARAERVHPDVGPRDFATRDVPVRECEDPGLRDPDLQNQANSMVAALRGLEGQDRDKARPASAKGGTGRHVA